MRAHVTVRHWDESDTWTWTAALEDGTLAPGVGSAESEDEANQAARSWAGDQVRRRRASNTNG